MSRDVPFLLMCCTSGTRGRAAYRSSNTIEFLPFPPILSTPTPCCCCCRPKLLPTFFAFLGAGAGCVAVSSPSGATFASGAGLLLLLLLVSGGHEALLLDGRRWCAGRWRAVEDFGGAARTKAGGAGALAEARWARRESLVENILLSPR